MEILPKLVWHYGEPFADQSAIPSFYLSELTRRHVTVALNGDGGDEDFAGYDRYAQNALVNRARWVPKPLLHAAASVLGRVGGDPGSRSLRARVARRADTLTLAPWDRYAMWMSYFRETELPDLYTPELRAELGDRRTAPSLVRDLYLGSDAAAFVDRLLDVDVNSYLPGDLLVKMDIATMAYSLEARSPLLDPEVMELGASLPAHLKLRGTEKKVVMRDALRGWIPDEILDRPKMGFGVPIVDWFRHDLREWTRDILLDPVARDRGWFDPGYVEATLDRHAAGLEDASSRIWALLVLEMWLREFVDSPRASAPALAAT
jgi:asparagine synthase (glutamine-hydrolysing)